MNSPLIYWRTIRHLRQEQIVGRVRRSVLRRRPAWGIAPPLRKSAGAFGAPILREGPIRQGSQFRFLNQDGAVADAADWNRHGTAKLWLYNLHYFDWLREQAAPARVDEDAAWIDRWIADNPPGTGTGWEPYPISLRIVNWIVWLMTTGRRQQAHLDSLADQTRQLATAIEYHLLGNHLFVNAKALVFAGSLFDGPEADGWRRRGLEILARELPEQILADGGHFELSPMYHALILEDVLDLLGLAAAYPDALSEPMQSLRLAEIATRMTGWLAAMTHPDGEISYFNDAAFGVAPIPAQIYAYAATRGVAAGASQEGLRLLRQSGYAVFDTPPYRLLFDCGRVGPDYLPGHAHADTLSFELSVGGARLITNSGTSTYAAGPERAWDRGTAAHATVQIDGENSAETWASFRVGRRPNVGPLESGRDGAADWVSCRHDGYRHLTGKPLHHRRISVGGDGVRVADEISGGGRHAVVGRFPLHPGVTVAHSGERQFTLTMPATTVTLSIKGDVAAGLEDGRFATAFGQTVVRPVVTWRRTGTLPLHVETHIEKGSA